MKVLSLFDGISCGMVALEKAGISIERYVAYEIEENAIKVSKHNYPMIEQKGDVFKAVYSEGEFDLLIGGSPCTYWSIARCPGLEHERETTSSGLGWELFMQYVRALKEAKPKYFLYENNESMAEAIKEEITRQLGVEPIMIDSAAFSAQKRKRYYWTNIPIDMSFQKSELVFADIEYKHDYKALSFSKYKETLRVSQDGSCYSWDTSGKGNYSQQNRARIVNCKMNTLPSSGSDKNNIYLGECSYRRIHPIEAERLQTLPDDYTSCLQSHTKRIECVGNGWTVDVIAHILKFLKEKENKQMELRVNEVQLPEQILFNYEELKQELVEKVSMYETMVYTDEQIKEAKADKANLNKLKKALNDERIRREKEYMQPFNDFKAKINEIIGIIDKPVAVIDKQVKEFEEKKKQEKYDDIRFYWEEKVNANNVPEYIKLEQIFNEKWLNASVSMKSIQDEITSRLEQIETDLATLSNLPEFGFEATEVYKTTLDINKALNEGRRLSEMAKRKAEHEEAMRKIAEEQKAKVAKEEQVEGQVEFTDAKSFDENVLKPAQEGFMNPPIEEAPAKQWVRFQAFITVEQAKELKQFFDSRNIEFKAV